MTTHEVLVAARNLIDREGWRTGAPEGTDCRGRTGYCISGAVTKAMFGEVRDIFANPALEPVNALFRQEYGRSGWIVNDSLCRSKEDALAALDRLIALTAPAPADPFTAGPVGRASFREPVRS